MYFGMLFDKMVAICSSFSEATSTDKAESKCRKTGHHFLFLIFEQQASDLNYWKQSTPQLSFPSLNQFPAAIRYLILQV